jgi:pyruvate dehydrogenase E1 component beta subunit
MTRTVAETIRSATRSLLLEEHGLLLGQCVTAVGWIGGTVPELTEADGIVELPMADVAGAGMTVGAALSGRPTIYVIRYQGFMWYNAAPLLNYAAKSKDMWGIPCPVLVRSIAMEGAIGPVASAAHHSMVMRMPGMPVVAPMTPGEWMEAWNWWRSHDDPLYISEHRRSFVIDRELPDDLRSGARITLIGISASRLNAMEAQRVLSAQGIACDMIHCVWLKPFAASATMLASLSKTQLGLVIDSDFETAAAGRSIAYELMHQTGAPVHALGLEERSAGFSPASDNPSPTPERIVAKVRALLGLPVNIAP